jgi:DNA-binding LytR/AlgR family response regulator
VNVFIAEDEIPARERLVESLQRVAPRARVAGQAASVRETAAWLRTHEAPDLLLLDVQLEDGLSLELFAPDSPALACPVVFTTAYDEFALAAFRAHAIDYLLKPVDEARLAAALEKLARIAGRSAADFARLAAAFGSAPSVQRPPARRRLLGRQGTHWVALAPGDIACIVSIDKLAYALDRQGRRWLLDGTLGDLERELDPEEFFRANRQTLVRAAAVAGFQVIARGRLAVDLQLPQGLRIDVPPERSTAFKAWLAR